MKNFYFTFGIAHPFGNFYVEVVAEDKDEARSVMFGIFGANWAFCYTEKDKKSSDMFKKLVPLVTLYADGSYTSLPNPEPLFENFRWKKSALEWLDMIPKKWRDDAVETAKRTSHEAIYLDSYSLPEAVEKCCNWRETKAGYDAWANFISDLVLGKGFLPYPEE